MAPKSRLLNQLLESYSLLEKVQDLVQAFVPSYHIVVCPAGFGEAEWAQRIQAACRELGWFCTVIKEGEPFTDARPEKVDMVIYMRDAVKRPELKSQCSYLAVSDCSQEWLCKNGEALRSFQGILSSVAVNPDTMVDILRFQLPVLRWLPSCLPSSSNATQTEAIVFRSVFYCGTQWDVRRAGYPFAKIYAWLDRHKLFEVYGPKEAWGGLNGWRGLMPAGKDDGRGIVEAIKNCGIALVLHSNGHLSSGAPTSRIFESAAAGAIIISDRHPFVVKHFSDCVLFLQEPAHHNHPLERQVETHLQWIIQNPERARAMAKRAQKIADQWNLFHQLEALANFHIKSNGGVR